MIYVLVLNSIRGAAENRDPVAVSRDRQALVDWIDEQRHRNPDTGVFEGWNRKTKRRIDTLTEIGVEVDYTWGYVFKEGSPIQDFNLPGPPTVAEPEFPGMRRVLEDPDSLPYGEDNYGCGIIKYPDREEQAEVARQQWDNMMSSLVTVPEGTVI